MREIIFRGKQVDDGEWVFGFFWKDLWGDGESCYIFCLDGEDTLVDPSTVGQYTGLKDKNGVKIFEGDIVRLIHKRNGTIGTWDAVVEFGNPNGTYSWGWQLKPITECKFNPDILLWVDIEETGAFCEVIGDIHDNPDLLERGLTNGDI